MSFLLDYFLGPISKPKPEQQQQQPQQQQTEQQRHTQKAQPTHGPLATAVGSHVAGESQPQAAGGSSSAAATPPSDEGPAPAAAVPDAAASSQQVASSSAASAGSAAAASAQSAAAAASSASASAAAAPAAPVPSGPPSDEQEAWMTLLRIRECFVYNVSARVGLGAYQAEAWGLDSPIFTGELHVVARGHTLQLRLQEPGGRSNTSSGGDTATSVSGLFASSVELNTLEAGRSIPLDAFLEPVRDSSRYFVIRVRSPSGQIASLGIGFRERTSAFDLNAALQDRARTVQRHAQLEAGLQEEMAGVAGSSGSAGGSAALSREEAERLEVAAAEQRLARNHTDLSLKGRIHVHLKPAAGGAAAGDHAAAPGGPAFGGSRRGAGAAGGKSHVKLAGAPRVDVIPVEGAGFRLVPPPDAAASAAAAQREDEEEEAEEERSRAEAEGHEQGEGDDGRTDHGSLSETAPTRPQAAPTTLSPGHAPVRPAADRAPPPLQLEHAADQQRAEGQPAAAVAAAAAADDAEDEFTDFASAH